METIFVIDNILWQNIVIMVPTKFNLDDIFCDIYHILLTKTPTKEFPSFSYIIFSFSLNPAGMKLKCHPIYFIINVIEFSQQSKPKNQLYHKHKSKCKQSMPHLIDWTIQHVYNIRKCWRFRPAFSVCPMTLFCESIYPNT